jgi:hypothetical protein
MNICQGEAEFHPGGRTDTRDEATSRFSQFFEIFQKYGMSSWTEIGWFR